MVRTEDLRRPERTHGLRRGRVGGRARLRALRCDGPGRRALPCRVTLAGGRAGRRARHGRRLAAFGPPGCGVRGALRRGAHDPGGCVDGNGRNGGGRLRVAREPPRRAPAADRRGVRTGELAGRRVPGGRHPQPAHPREHPRRGARLRAARRIPLASSQRSRGMGECYCGRRVGRRDVPRGRRVRRLYVAVGDVRHPVDLRNRRLGVAGDARPGPLSLPVNEPCQQ